LEVGGNFTGTIDVLNLAAPAAGVQTASGRRGIYVGGTLGGTVYVRGNVENSRIVTRRFDGTYITIDGHLQGAICSFGRELGDPDDLIAHIDVGLATTNPYMGGYQGMSGGDCPPTDMSQPPGGPVNNWWLDGPVCASGFDPVIRASFLKECLVRNMSLESAPGVRHPYKPRIEGKSSNRLAVGDLSAAGEMREGVIWSGELDGDPSHRYIKVLQGFNCGCVGPAADLWLDFAHGTVPLYRIEGDLLGEIHLPQIPEGHTLRIRGKLGDRHDQCGCASASTFPAAPAVQPCPGQSDVTCLYACANDPGENTPRGYPSPAQLSPRSLIDIAQPLGLKGQIVINAGASSVPPECWVGELYVPQNTATPSTYVMAPTNAALAGTPPSPAYKGAPSYRVASGPVGGGAAGRVPYLLYDEDCTPPRPRSESTLAEVSVQRLQVDGIRLRWYGPVAMGSIDSFTVEGYNGDGDYQGDFSGLFYFAPSFANPREIVCRSVPGVQDLETMYLLTDWTFRIIPSTDSLTRPLLCTSLADGVTADVPVAPFSYRFKLIYDCDEDGVNDLLQIANPALMLDCNGDLYIDWCQINGHAPGHELTDEYTPSMRDITQAIHEPDGKPDCCQCFVPRATDEPFCRGSETQACNCHGNTDFNHNGVVEILDIFAFLTAWFNGDMAADYNQNMVVSGDLFDIFDFLSDWFNMCGPD
jgi:hypothetical protein